MTGLNQGLQGVATGTPMNSVGLIYYNSTVQSNRGDEAATTSSMKTPPCAVGEVQWHSEGRCFVPNQFHINVAVFSVCINLVFIVVVCILACSKKKGQ